MEQQTFSALASDKEVLVSITSLFDITESELISIIGCGDKKMWRVLNSENAGFDSGTPLTRFTSLKFLLRALSLRMPIDKVTIWLKQSNSRLNGQKPMDLLISGRVTSLQAWVSINNII